MENKKLCRLVDCITNSKPIRYNGGLYYPYAFYCDFFLVSESLVPDGFNITFDIAFDDDYQFVEDNEFLDIDLFNQFDSQRGSYNGEGLLEEGGDWSIEFKGVDDMLENYYLYNNVVDYNRDLNLLKAKLG